MCIHRNASILHNPLRWTSLSHDCCRLPHRLIKKYMYIRQHRMIKRYMHIKPHSLIRNICVQDHTAWSEIYAYKTAQSDQEIYAYKTAQAVRENYAYKSPAEIIVISKKLPLNPLSSPFIKKIFNSVPLISVNAIRYSLYSYLTSKNRKLSNLNCSQVIIPYSPLIWLVFFVFH